ncbi:MAG: hypothetical protein CMF53_04110 [Legionellales bacterium]|nr:hypothetical protein [Legionellales bacterium]HCU90398.1 hypothetical protein [Gammaproteobacteria bacterium]
MKIGVLSNPLSRRNVSNLSEIRECARQLDNVLHIELADFGALKNALNDFAAAEIQILVINAGDGTVGAVLTEIFELGGYPNYPKLAILPGGTSNTIAADVGLKGDRVKSLRRLVAILERGEVEQYCVVRRLIRVDYDPTQTAAIGLFFGTAGICDAIKLRRRLFPQKWIPDVVAGALTLGYVLGGVLLSRSEVLSGHMIAVELDAVSESEKSFSIIVVTTLNQIFLGSSPFWSTEGGPLKFTSIGSPAVGLVRNAYRLLYGKNKDCLPEVTYKSASVHKIQLRMNCPFNLDGQFMQPPPEAIVTLTSPGSAKFVRC